MGEVVKPDGRAGDRAFRVGGINEKGWDPETKTNRPMLSVTFSAWGRGARMDCVADEMVKVAGDE